MSQDFFSALFLVYRKIKFFLLLTFLFWLSGALLILLVSKIKLQIFLATFHSSFFDYFFRYFTFLGNGVWFIFLLLYLFFANRKFFICVFLYAIFLLAITQFLKFYFSYPRPMAIFEQINISVHKIPGLIYHKKNSFPSGHTITAFAIAFVLSYILEKKFWQIILFIYALTLGYSRIYLSQHFFIDVLFGSIISIFAGLICFSILIHYYETNRNNLSRFRGNPN